MKAIILAAGEGRRLDPLTNRRPKPMLPIAGKPLMEYVVDSIIESGIEEIILVVGYRRDRIQTYFGDGDAWGVDIEYAVQENQLGTGHAMLQAEPSIDGQFIVLNGDRIIESSGIEAVIDAASPNGEAVFTVTRSEQPSDYGVVEIEGTRPTAITEKPRTETVPTDTINAGVYGFDTTVFDVLRSIEPDQAGELKITAALEELIGRGDVRIVRYRGPWVDVSHLWDVSTVTTRVLEERGGASDGHTDAGASIADTVYIGTDSRVGANATVRRGTSVGDNVSVGANAVLSKTVVFTDATVGDGAVLRESVVGENSYVGPNVTVAGGPADMLVDGTLHKGVGLGAVIGDTARIGGGAVLGSGTVVNDGAIVEEGAVVSGRVSSNTEVRRG